MRGAGKHSEAFISLTFLTLLLVVNACYFYWNAFRLFVFWDMGAFLASSWRVVCGQAPYRDFLFIMTPVHIYLNALFIKLLGFTKLAVWVHLIVLSSIVAVWTYWALRARFKLFAAAVLTVLSLVSFNWQVAHPWYTQTALFWGLLAGAYFLRCLPFRSAKEAFGCALFAGIMAMLSFMTKINVGAAFLTVYFCVLWAGNFKLKALAGYAAGLALAFACVGFFMVHDWTTFIKDVFLIYPQSQSSRFQYLFYPQAIFNNFYWLVFLIVLLTGRRPSRETLPQWLLFAGFWAVAHFSTFTSSNNLRAEFPLMGIYVAAGILLVDRERIREILLVLAAGLIALCVYHGVKLTAWWYNPQTQNYPLEMKAFEGWKCNRVQGFALNMFAHSLTELPKEDTILMLGDLQMIYGLTGRTPYPGVPDAWASEACPAPGDQWERVRTAILTNLPAWIIMHKRYGAEWLVDIANYLKLESTIQTRYAIAVEYGPYIVLRRIR